MLHPDREVTTNNQAVEQRLKNLHQRRAQAIAAINKVANRNPAPEGQFKRGDQVWLEATNLKLPYHTLKLAPRRQGPFHVTEVISPVAYRLALPVTAAWINRSRGVRYSARAARRLRRAKPRV